VLGCVLIKMIDPDTARVFTIIMLILLPINRSSFSRCLLGDR